MKSSNQLPLEMIPCPRCGEDFPKKRQELGYHVCINCSTAKPKVAITTVEGEGDHTYNDIIILDQDQAMAIARKQAETSNKKLYLEGFTLEETDEFSATQAVRDTVRNIVDLDIDED